MLYYVYILKSNAFGNYYTGSCVNVEIRLKEHNTGNVRSTKIRRPWQLVHQEEFHSRSEAVQRERQIKSWKKREAIEKLLEKKYYRQSIEDPRYPVVGL